MIVSRSRCFAPVFLLLLLLSLSAFGAVTREQPRYDLSKAAVDVAIESRDNRLEGTAVLRFRLVDKTNFVSFRLNGNLAVTGAQDGEGQTLRFIQDDTDRFEVMVNLGRPFEPGTEMTVKITFGGVFARGDFDFLRAAGHQSLAYIGTDSVELPSTAYWFPMPLDPTSRALYEIRMKLPGELRPVSAGVSEGDSGAGPVRTWTFRTPTPTLPPPLLAAHYQERELSSEGMKIKALFFSEFPERDDLLRQTLEVIKYLRQRMGYDAGAAPLLIVEVPDRYADPFGFEGGVFLPTRELTAKAPNLREFIRRFAYQRWLFPLHYASRGDIWIAEGLSQYTSSLYTLEKKGKEPFDAAMRLLAIEALRSQDTETVQNGYRLGVGTEAYRSVVVAKSAWIFHMLRSLMGPESFDRLLRELPGRASTTPLGTEGLAQLVKEISGKDYGWFFDEWTGTVDLPEFQADYLVYRIKAGGYQTIGKIDQNLAVFRFPLEIRMAFKEGEELRTLDVTGASTRLNMETKSRPLKVELDPNFRILRKSRELEIQVHLLKGDEAFENGDFIPAIDAYKRAIDMDPRNSLAYYKMAMVFYEQFNYNTAINTFRDALNGTLKPDWVEALCHLYIGKVFDVLGQRERALAEYNKAVNTKDDSRGAVTEAQKYISRPFTREKTFMGQPVKNADETPAPKKESASSAREATPDQNTIPAEKK